MRLLLEGGVRADDVVIIDEVKHPLPRIERPRLRGEEAGEGRFDLEEVIAVERGDHALEALVIGDGVEALGADVLLKVAAVDDFAHEEEILLFGIYGAAEELHEPLREEVADVEAEAVDPELADQ